MPEAAHNVPVVTIGLRLETGSRRETLVHGLEQLVMEDPTLSVHTDQRSGDVVIAGMGELQLEIVVSRLQREFGVDVRRTTPRPAYREALTQPADGDGHQLSHASGRIESADVKIHVYPGQLGAGYTFENLLPSEAIPSQFVSEGIAEAATRGVLAGYPVDDIRVQLYHGSSHGSVSAATFRKAGSMAFQDAARKAAPVVVEPVMCATITSPPEYAAAVMEGLASRGATLRSEVERQGRVIVQVTARLSRMFGYAADLRGRTQGRATYSLVFDRYEPVSGRP